MERKAFRGSSLETFRLRRTLKRVFNRRAEQAVAGKITVIFQTVGGTPRSGPGSKIITGITSVTEHQLPDTATARFHLSGNDPVRIVAGIKPLRQPDLFLIAAACNPLRSLFRSVQCRKKHTRKNSDDRNHNEELYQCENPYFHP